jgi:hypothetical protein
VWSAITRTVAGKGPGWLSAAATAAQVIVGIHARKPMNVRQMFTSFIPEKTGA